MTSNKNNTSIIRREILIRICKVLLHEDYENIDRIPIELKPKNKGSWRCCVYKDRAVLKYKIMAILGFSEKDETDELTPLSYYAKNPLGTKNFFLSTIDEACSNCQASKYVVTNSCRGCDARPCQINCPKDAVVFRNGKAQILDDRCVNCGKCEAECPFNAISFIARPCENVCPVNAIYENENGKECIDTDKCILCGKCVLACPFGAIIPSSNLPQIITDVKNNVKLIAVTAPSIAGQFREQMSSIYGSIIKLGFDDIVPVATGADITIGNEASELNSLIEKDKDTFLASSCCPSWVYYVNNQPDIDNKILSETLSPLNYTCKKVKKENPDAKVVFIAPCVAKKKESLAVAECDYCISFEELGALLVASNIEISNSEKYIPQQIASAEGYGFAKAGGVAQAIKQNTSDQCKIESINNLNKSNIRQIKKIIKKRSYNFLEVMSCEGGCLGGNLSIVSKREAERIFSAKP